MEKEPLSHGHVFALAGNMHRLIAEAVIFFNHDVPEGEKRPGGYLAVVDAYTGLVVMMIAVGTMDELKRRKYFEFSVRKALQLYMYLKTCRTSFECQHAGFPQGAVYASEYIFSFSGQLSDVDEAISHMLAVRFPNYRDKKESRKGITALNKIVKNITQNEKCFQLGKGFSLIA